MGYRFPQPEQRGLRMSVGFSYPGEKLSATPDSVIFRLVSPESSLSGQGLYHYEKSA